MLVPLAKFVVFTLAPALVMIWSTSPDLWGNISHSFHSIGANPNQFLHIFEDIPRRAQYILTTNENIVRCLVCDELEFPASKQPPLRPKVCPAQRPSEDPIVQAQEDGLGTQESAPKSSPWLLGGMILMGLDFYFPQLSAVSSLWMPLQVAIPVLYWMVSWWILPPGWEPNLVSLSPSITFVVYLDDIIVFSQDQITHLHHLCAILNTLYKHQLKAKPSKYELFQ
ncbi:hypothetical protein DSO57_1018374 [Entomophthora muscae]|uniref:Uncharacterized protein n=1 Tax=Entomophthora muscae TaxID=34485 RepID=A0ACC2T472_9FUNG|nr:hypothetical protein DSO57_1018374 [Entomophthora muscae]